MPTWLNRIPYMKLLRKIPALVGMALLFASLGHADSTQKKATLSYFFFDG